MVEPASTPSYLIYIRLGFQRILAVFCFLIFVLVTGMFDMSVTRAASDTQNSDELSELRYIISGGITGYTQVIMRISPDGAVMTGSGRKVLSLDSETLQALKARLQRWDSKDDVVQSCPDCMYHAFTQGRRSFTIYSNVDGKTHVKRGRPPREQVFAALYTLASLPVDDVISGIDKEKTTRRCYEAVHGNIAWNSNIHCSEIVGEP